MFVNTRCIEDWAVLVERLDRRRAVHTWAAAEPALWAAGGIGDLADLTGPGVPRESADALLGALVRTAAGDGGDDPDAVLVLVHLLSNGLLRLVRRLPGSRAETLPVLIGELACQIRRFPWRARTRRFASNLLLDTYAAAKELRPRSAQGDQPTDPAVFHRWAVAPLPDARMVLSEEQLLPAAGDEAGDELVELLLWAVDNGVASRADLMLLTEVYRGRGARCRVAAEWGLSERTVRRRRDRTLAALRGAADRYLAEVA